MATRWRLREADSLADIGCGLCHWSRLLYPYLHAPARLVGVDREERWVTEGARNLRRAFPKVPPDLLTVAQLSGTSVAMIERHYGHLRADHAAAALATLALCKRPANTSC